MTTFRARLVLFVLSSELALAQTARADTTDQCITESETGQRLFLERHFVESRPHLVACGRAQCPAVVTRDCVERLRQVEASIASVLLSAKHGDGTDARDARVFVDDAPTPYRPTGEAVELNPGTHGFRFELPGAPPVVRRLVIDEGARLQSVTATFADRASGHEEPPSSGWSTRKTVALVVGGVGIAGLAAGGVFGLLASSSLSKERTDCGPSSTCASYQAGLGDYNAANTFATASTIAFVAGGVLVAGGAVLWLTSPSRGGAPAAGAMGLSPILGPEGGGLTLRGAF
jgi:hypothetical protein